MAEPNQQSLANYQILKLLGKGGQGSAYLAKNKITGNEVVLKEIKCSDEKAQLQAQLEIDIHQKSNFKYIVNFIDSWAEEKQGEYMFYIVMEYCDQGSLLDYIKLKKNQRKPVKEEYAWNILVQLVLG
ncbi:MAG: hypothetical protein EZS28_046353, partial [Streblomastix strix]